VHRRHPSRNRCTDPRQAIGRTALPVAPLGACLTPQVCASTAAFSHYAAATTSASPEVLAALNHSPTARTLEPTAVQAASGSIMSLQKVLNGRSTRTFGANSALTLDCGQDVGGVTTLSYASASDPSRRVGLTFSESPCTWAPTATRAAAATARTGRCTVRRQRMAPTPCPMPMVQLRGGFRYLTVCLDTSGRWDLNGVGLSFTSPPGKANPADCANCFYSSDDLLNRTWYAGAHTVQLGTIASDLGRAWPPRPPSPKATSRAAPPPGVTKSCHLTT
jgi:hypothetical protein